MLPSQQFHKEEGAPGSLPTPVLLFLTITTSTTPSYLQLSEYSMPLNTCIFAPKLVLPHWSVSFSLLVLYFLDQLSLCDTSETTIRTTAERIAHCFLRTVPGTCASYSICQIAVYHLVASILSTPQRDPQREAVTYSSLHSWYLVQSE